MVDLDTLAAFDLLQWLRTGERAGQVLDRSQSTISRATRRCEDTLGVRLIKRNAEWQLEGDDTLLRALRHVHQEYRWRSALPLRLEAQHWLSHSYGDLPLQGWLKGNFNYLEYTRPLQLLQDRVIDAWLCSVPDQPQADELVSIQLCAMPAWLIARSNHPLAQLEHQRVLEAAMRYPVLPLPQGAFPVFQACLDRLGFHSDFSQLKSIADDLGHDPRTSEDLALAIASPLTLPLYGDGWTVLPLDLGIRVGDAVLLRSEFADHPRAVSLIEALALHLRTIAADHPEVQLLVELPVR